MDYAPRHIKERTALHTAVRLSRAMPMTAVGTIFKSPQQTPEVERLVRDEAVRLSFTLAVLERRAVSRAWRRRLLDTR